MKVLNTEAMNGKIHHLLLGVFLFVLYVLLASMEMLMRLSDALAPSQTLGEFQT